MDGDPAYGHIVVGVDGSPTSRAALRWAAREAELRRCALDVVYGWQVKGEPRPPGEWGGVAPPIEAYQQQARARTQGVVDEVLPNGARCELHVHAIHKPPGRALLSFCGTADLLVVGAKERGRLAGWLVGSTFDAALKNATCTVVVVRPPAQDAAAGDAAAGAAATGDAAAGDAAAGAALAKGAPAKGAPAAGAPAAGAPAARVRRPRVRRRRVRRRRVRRPRLCLRRARRPRTRRRRTIGWRRGRRARRPKACRRGTRRPGSRAGSGAMIVRRPEDDPGG
jgi:nucleotide-binding universal stress UspA family protein